MFFPHTQDIVDATNATIAQWANGGIDAPSLGVSSVPDTPSDRQSAEDLVKRIHSATNGRSFRIYDSKVLKHVPGGVWRASNKNAVTKEALLRDAIDKFPHLLLVNNNQTTRLQLEVARYEETLQNLGLAYFCGHAWDDRVSVWTARTLFSSAKPPSCLEPAYAIRQAAWRRNSI